MSSRSYDHVLGFALSHPWSIMPEMLQVIAGVLARRIAGLEADQVAIDAALVNRKNLPQPQVGSVAIIPVSGVLAPRMNMLFETSGVMSYEKLSGRLREAVSNPAIRTIVLDVDSPGGSVAGNAEFASEIMRARTKKPIVAVAQYTMGSAAYQLSAAATEIVAAPSARVGAIGTYTIHDDMSEALAKLGVKRTYISAGAGKVDGNETEPLSKDALARITAAVNDAYSQFVSTVVKGRGAGMTADRVRDEWKAHVYGASEALSIGMIDSIGTLDETLSRLLSASPDADDKRAALALLQSDDTAQEPAKATAQDRQADLALEQALFEMTLT